MSKKIQMLLIAGLFCVSLAGCDKKATDENINQDLSGDSKTSEIKNVVENSGDEPMMQTMERSGLADLIGRGAKVRCEYQMKEGNGEVNVTTYIDGAKFRAETNATDMEAISVFDGEVYYSWTKGVGSQGTKMTRSCLENIKTNAQEDEVAQGENQFESVDDIVMQENELKMNCQEVDEIDFEIPTDIQFIDTCKMMEGLENQTQNMEELQKQMEQMQKGL